MLLKFQENISSSTSSSQALTEPVLLFGYVFVSTSFCIHSEWTGSLLTLLENFFRLRMYLKFTCSDGFRPVCHNSKFTKLKTDPDGWFTLKYWTWNWTCCSVQDGSGLNWSSGLNSSSTSCKSDHHSGFSWWDGTLQSQTKTDNNFGDYDIGILHNPWWYFLLDIRTQYFDFHKPIFQNWWNEKFYPKNVGQTLSGAKLTPFSTLHLILKFGKFLTGCSHRKGKWF